MNQIDVLTSTCASFIAMLECTAKAILPTLERILSIKNVIKIVYTRAHQNVEKNEDTRVKIAPEHVK